ncbi:MAG: hypothetical protein JW891_09400 [Candidatus Lokiarchaeota archaeon]|nr:hypothetical protein [Candidatus Lokiarchaeota archaeon]
MKNSKTREILLNMSFDFFVPEIVMIELKKYIPYIVQKSGLKEVETIKLLNFLLENLKLVPLEEYIEKLPCAMEIMSKIDEKDAQFVALGLLIKNDGI